MTKSELVNKISNELNANVMEIKDVVDMVFDEITESLLSGEKVVVSGFGTFKPVTRKERTVISPMVVDPIYVPQKTVIKFIPSTMVEWNNK